MDPRRPSEGYASYNYQLELQGKVLAGFTHCVGLHSCDEEATSEFCQRALSEDQEDVLVLEGGKTNSLYIWEWYSRMLGGKPQKQPLTIVQKRDDGEEYRWQIDSAWPIKWDGQALSRDDDVISIKSLEICHQGADVKS